MLWSNERVTLLGNWQHGFFAMTFLAATALVGRMKLDAEPDLKTNQVGGLTDEY
jgi:phosphatidylserine decarboxylase